MAPGTSQTVNFTATAMVPTIDFFSGVSSYYLSGKVLYNQSSTNSFQTSFSQTVPIYDPTITSFNPSLRNVISPPTPHTPAGATDLVIVTANNTRAANVTKF